MKHLINKEVAITAIGFKKNLSAYPRQMEFEGNTYRFIDAGLSCMIRSGERVCRILTMSDGLQQFRLRCDARGSVWTLLSVDT